jgi:hypothetical protein
VRRRAAKLNRSFVRAIFAPNLHGRTRISHVRRGELHFVSGDGYLMPARKDQEPPDLRYFKQGGK